jgi:tRNA(fMet)-specific endonuclease VapC
MISWKTAGIKEKEKTGNHFNMFLLDTNICIYAIKKKPESLLKKISANWRNGICISSLTIAELEFGIANSKYPDRNRVALLEFLSIFTVLSFDEKDAIPYGLIKSRLRKKGIIIGPIDLLLAAQAISNDLVLVTNNVREFKRVEDLRIEDWSN